MWRWKKRYQLVLFGKYRSAEVKFLMRCLRLLQSAPENLPIHDLRKQILRVCEQDQQFPRDFIYLRSVGRCLTKVGLEREDDEQ